MNPQVGPEFLSDKDNVVLALQNRRLVYELVRSFAGCHFRELERRSTMPAGTLKYHLDYLSRNGLVQEVKEQNSLRYFPRSIVTADAQLLALLRQASVRSILLFVLTHKNCSHEMIVSHVKLSPSTVSWHLKKLESAGVIDSKKSGRHTFFTLKLQEKELMNLLVAYQASFFDAFVDRVVEMWDGS